MKQSLVVLCLTVAALGAAEKPVDGVNKGKDGVAVKGYDVVAYFDQSKPVRGSKEFQQQWQGATWQFSSAANRDKFAAAPERYAPQFGGYCAWAVGHGYTADTDPEAWKIIDGKLYLNYNKSIQKKWEPEASKWIPEGMRNWPALHK